MLNYACIEVKCKILKANGQPADASKKVWPVNNFLHSAFSIVRVNINERRVSKQPDHYPYKAYISALLTYNGETKNAQLAAQGYFSDVGHHMGNSEEDYAVNTGHQQRLKLFRKKNDDTAAYKEDGVKVFGRLHLDLISTDTGLIPGSKVQIQLVKSPSKFVLMRQPGDNEDYMFKITDCYLYVPVASVSAPVYSEISSILSQKSVSLHFRRTEIRPITIPKGKIEFNSETLFSDEMPCRVVLCFVEEEGRKGDYSKNPFDFRRSWDIEEGSGNQSVETKEEILERELSNLKQQFEELRRRLVSQQEPGNETI